MLAVTGEDTLSLRLSRPALPSDGKIGTPDFGVDESPFANCENGPNASTDFGQCHFPAPSVCNVEVPEGVERRRPLPGNDSLRAELHKRRLPPYPGDGTGDYEARIGSPEFLA